MTNLKCQVASDVVRDGLGLELLDSKGNVVAEVFREDTDKTVDLNTFSYDVSVDSIEELLSRARRELGPVRRWQAPSAKHSR
jgi:hypothetical protein